MMIVTTESIHEERYQVLGLVRGCSAYSKNAVKDIGQAFKSVVGGELKSSWKWPAPPLQKRWKRRRKPSAQTQSLASATRQ